MAVEPYDEEAILAGDTIIRRINPDQHVVPDENRQVRRISSKAFNKSSGPKAGMSVDVEGLIIAAGINPRQYVTNPIFTGSVAFTAGDVRSLDLLIGYEEIVSHPGVPDNPYHGEVWAKTERKSFSDSQKTGLASIARWYVEIPGVELI